MPMVQYASRDKSSGKTPLDERALYIPSLIVTTVLVTCFPANLRIRPPIAHLGLWASHRPIALRGFEQYGTTAFTFYDILLMLTW